MKKFSLVLILSLFALTLFSQKIDTVINNGVYKSHFNYALKEPVYVEYTLFHGGGFFG